MGQYHLLVNLDKYEYVNPHTIGDGLKIWEQGASLYGTCSALSILLASSCKGGPRGGGDYSFDMVDETEETALARWVGDRVCWVGDYALDTDLPASDNASTIWERCKYTQEEWNNILLDRLNSEVISKEQHSFLSSIPMFTDISDLVVSALQKEFGVIIQKTEGISKRTIAGKDRLNAISIDTVITGDKILYDQRHYIETEELWH